MSTVKIIVAGEGGQGIQTIAKVITNTAAREKQNVSYIPSFGVEQRGTPSIAFITLSDDEIYYPRFNIADIVIVLQKRALLAVDQNIDPNKTKVIFDSSTIDSDLVKKYAHSFGIPATKVAQENFTAKSFNLIVLGKLCRLLNFNPKDVWLEVEHSLGKKLKDPKIAEASKKAFEAGLNSIFEVKKFSNASFSPATGSIISKGYDKTAEISPERCKGCGICIMKCPVGALKFSDTLGVFATPIPEIDLEKCIACGNCLRFCPDGAIAVSKDKVKNKK